MTKKNYGYGSYFENGKFYDKDGNEIKDLKSFYIEHKKKSTSHKINSTKKYGYGGDGSYERNENMNVPELDEEDFPENL